MSKISYNYLNVRIELESATEGDTDEDSSFYSTSETSTEGSHLKSESNLNVKTNNKVNKHISPLKAKLEEIQNRMKIQEEKLKEHIENMGEYKEKTMAAALNVLEVGLNRFIEAEKEMGRKRKQKEMESAMHCVINKKLKNQEVQVSFADESMLKRECYPVLNEKLKINEVPNEVMGECDFINKIAVKANGTKQVGGGYPEEMAADTDAFKIITNREKSTKNFDGGYPEEMGADTDAFKIITNREKGTKNFDRGYPEEMGADVDAIKGVKSREKGAKHLNGGYSEGIVANADTVKINQKTEEKVRNKSVGAILKKLL